MSNPTAEPKASEFEKSLEKLIEVACDWRLAWDGRGLSPEQRIQRAKLRVIKAHEEELREY